jgi:hypothetical protein
MIMAEQNKEVLEITIKSNNHIKTGLENLD